MTLDHIGIVFFDQLPLIGRCILFTPGGLTFPIMAFLLTEGYRHTSDFKKYALRLLIFAVIALVPFIWAIGPALDILFTLLLGLITIYLYDNMNNRVVFWFVFAGITFASSFCDWSFVGVPMVLCYHAISHPTKRLVVPVALSWIMMAVLTLTESMQDPAYMFSLGIPMLLFNYVGCTATIFLLRHYNGERGKGFKYFFYIYYPAHLLVLGILYSLLFGQLW